MVHRTELKVRFYELDPYDHVNHTSYFGYFETARVEALESIGWGLHRLKAIGVQIVVFDMTARFEVPAVAGDTLTVQSEVLEVKRASSRWRQTMTRDGETIATLDVKAASINTDGRPCRLPDGMAETLEMLRAHPELA
ncbi:MAG: acyl-CoA thioesterase [Acidimicrobiia bacterium]|nr:acyl-CoA thioesterase [Acidimicrobiia bacterium]MDH3398266.1 acyl-CoA thioesterase [Acidimicrobiia bacterium]MDH5615319.1 acyl-CoA thioesterase [Acidimicrobiia bacterium]